MADQDKSLTLQPSYLSDKREELTEILRSRLIECGWRDEVAKMCRNLIQKHGLDQISIDDIIVEVQPKARQMVPDSIKKEVLEVMRRMDKDAQTVNPNDVEKTVEML